MSSAAIVVIALVAFCLLLDLATVYIFAFYSLHPLLFLIFNIIQTGVWIALFVLDLLGAVENADDESSIYKHYGGWIVSFVTIAAFIGLLLYASVVYHRSRVSSHRRSIDFSAKDDDYRYQSDYSLDPYRIPAAQPFAPLTINRTPTEFSLESRSRHVDLDASRPKSTPETFAPYAPRKPSPLSNSQIASPTENADCPGQSSQRHGQSFAPPDTANLGSPISRWTSPQVKPPLTTGQIPIALIPGRGSPHSAVRSGEYVVNKRSLTEYQQTMYGQGVGETYELPAEP